MRWLRDLERLTHSGAPVVLVTIVRVRGHAPRGAGSKMLVTREQVVGSIGGGDLEQTAIARARAALAAGQSSPELLTLTLSPRGGEHALQCCGGEVTLVLEPLHPNRPLVAIFGAGHVGKALAQVLALLPLELRLIDARAEQLAQLQLPEDAAATLEAVHAPVPESAVADLPAGAHLLVLTHDHAEDLAIIDTALRRDDLGFLGLIGSSAKWNHFRRALLEQGHSEEALARITTPIGLPGVPGKSPAAIAIATAAQLLSVLELPEALF